MENVALCIGYGVIILGFIMIGLLFVMKILDYIPTPRKWIYKQMGRLARNEPDVFLNMMIYFKRKYNLKDKK